MCLKSSVIWLRALGPTAVGAAFAAAGIDDFGSAVGAGLAGFGTVFDVAFEGAGHTVGPCGDAVDVEVEFADKFYHVGDGHAVAEDAADEFGVVPVFLFEHAGEAADGDGVAVLVEELEVVAGMFVAFFFDADDPSLLYPFGEDETLGAAGEDFVGVVLIHTDDGNPVFFLVFEADNLGFEFLGAFGSPVFAELVAVFVLAFRDEDTVAGAFAAVI